MSKELGHVMLAGYRLPVVNVELQDGAVQVTAIMRGPTKRFKDMAPTLFGADGRGVMQGSRVTMDALKRGDTLTFSWTLTVDTVREQPTRYVVPYETP